jgi:hypothetical protein
MFRFADARGTSKQLMFDVAVHLVVAQARRVYGQEIGDEFLDLLVGEIEDSTSCSAPDAPRIPPGLARNAPARSHEFSLAHGLGRSWRILAHVQCGENFFSVLSRSYGDKHVGQIRCGDYAFDQAFPQTVIGTTRQDHSKLELVEAVA